MSDTAQVETPPPAPAPAAERPTSLGIYDRPKAEAVTGIEITAIVLSVVWLIGSAIFFLFAPFGQQCK